jgi:hypothetical protein
MSGSRRESLSSHFDSNLQMFCETVVEPRPAVLRFYRWLAECGELEHTVSEPISGEWAHHAVKHAARHEQCVASEAMPRW